MHRARRDDRIARPAFVSRSRRRDARKHNTDHSKKPPNSSASATVWLASRWEKAQTFTPSTIGWCTAALIWLPGT